MPNKNYILSIIIPVYNVSKYLPKCLESVSKQKHKNIEIILVNDGSTDNSGDICNEFARTRDNTIVIHKKNGGLSSARNAGLKKATGEYIWFVDSDDWIDKNSVQKITAYLEEHDIEILHFNYIEFLEDKEEFKSHKSRKEKTFNTSGSDYLKTHPFVPMVWTYVYNRTFLLDNKLVFNEEVINEDVEFSMISLSVVKKMSYLPEILYFYRIRENSQTSIFSIIKVDSLFSMIKVCRELEGKGLPVKFLNRRIYFTINTYLYFVINGNYTNRIKINRINKLKSVKIKLNIENGDSSRTKLKKRIYNVHIYLYVVYIFLKSRKENFKQVRIKKESSFK